MLLLKSRRLCGCSRLFTWRACGNKGAPCARTTRRGVGTGVFPSQGRAPGWTAFRFQKQGDARPVSHPNLSSLTGLCLPLARRVSIWHVVDELFGAKHIRLQLLQVSGLRRRLKKKNRKKRGTVASVVLECAHHTRAANTGRKNVQTPN